MRAVHFLCRVSGVVDREWSLCGARKKTPRGTAIVRTADVHKVTCLRCRKQLTREGAYVEEAR